MKRRKAAKVEAEFESKIARYATVRTACFVQKTQIYQLRQDRTPELAQIYDYYVEVGTVRYGNLS